MINYKIYLFILFLLLSPSLNGQFNYSQSGYGIATTVNRLSDGTIIKLPYRMLSYDAIVNVNNFNLIVSTAIEFHIKSKIANSKLKIDFREVYLEWILPYGDLSLGKQIVSWGAVSANNPTDNISPYNYYYLFSIGKERKQGIFSLNSNIYINNIMLNTIFIPFHNPNLLPLNDPEFAISSPIIPKDEQILDLNNSYEYGISLKMPINYLDLTLSYFSGYDKIVSFFGANVWSNKVLSTETIKADTVLSYRKTNMFGLGFSSLFNDFEFSSDMGIFNTFDNIKDINNLKRDYDEGQKFIISECENKNLQLPSWASQIENCEDEPTLKEILKLDNSALYSQINLELTYMPNSDLRIITQYLKQNNLNFGKADSLTLSTETVLLDPEDLFISGLGAPNTSISTNSLTLVLQKSLPESNLDIQFTSLYDLLGMGNLFELRCNYSISNNLNFLFALNKIFAGPSLKKEISGDIIEINPFISMQNFSHIRMEIKYSF